MHRLTLRARLVLVVLAGVLSFLAFNLGSVYANYRQDRVQAGRQALELARGLALAVDGALRTRIAALEVLSLSRTLAAGDIEGFRAEAEAVVARQTPGSNILLLQQDGQQLLNTALPPGAPLPRRQQRENHDRVFATGRPSVSGTYFGVVVRRPIVAIDVPVHRADGSVGQVLAMNPTPDAFDALIRAQQPAKGTIITILDRAGVRVARVPGDARLVGQPAMPDFLRAWSAAPEGILEATSPEGTPVLAAFSRLPDIGWTVAVAVETAALTGPAWRAALTSLAVGLSLLALGLLLAVRVARGILGPIASLRQLAASADANGMPVPVTTGLQETDDVATILLTEARRRRAATASLLDSERRLRLVVNELNHRAKNALATVQALAHQTARGEAGADPARFAAAFSARLRTLARAHDLLTSFSWEAAALDAIVDAGLAPWLTAEGGEHPQVAVRCGCTEMRASPGQAQALVMALHELAMNATKYGALSTPEGRVEVTCHSDDAARSAVVEWRESGGPPVPGPPVRHGFGTRLLARALAHDLGPGASVSLEFATTGVRATIRFALRTT